MGVSPVEVLGPSETSDCWGAWPAIEGGCWLWRLNFGTKSAARAVRGSRRSGCLTCAEPP